MKQASTNFSIVALAALCTLIAALACGGIGANSIVVVDTTQRIEAGSSIRYDLSEYESCEYVVQSQNDDIDVNGERAITHENSTRANRLTISNEYSLLTSKTVDIWIECQT